MASTEIDSDKWNYIFLERELRIEWKDENIKKKMVNRSSAMMKIMNRKSFAVMLEYIKVTLSLGISSFFFVVESDRFFFSRKLDFFFPFIRQFIKAIINPASCLHTFRDPLTHIALKTFYARAHKYARESQIWK